MKAFVHSAVLAIISAATVPAFAAEEHGHCSGASVCKGDAACEKQGFKELTKEECSKIGGAKFEASSHAGESHKDGKHDHDKK